MIREWLNKFSHWHKAIHVWIIGPGLGRDAYMEDFFPRMVKELPDKCVVVFDADGIHYLCRNPQLFPELSRFKTIMTPNHK